MRKKLYVDWVDYAKAIGIILVVYGHVARGVLNAGIFENEHAILFIDRFIYSFHMPLFFFLSGLFFIVSLDKRGPQGLVVNKLNILMYPYFIWSIIQFSIHFTMVGFTNFVVSQNSFYSFLWQPTEHFWFLYTLFVMFLLYTLIYKLTSSMIYTIGFFFLIYLFSDALEMPWVVLSSVCHFGVFFGLGIAVNKYKNIHIKLSWCIMATLLLLFLYGLNLFLLESNSLFFKKMMSLFIASIAIMCIVFYSKLLAIRDVTWLKKIGSLSMEIYLVHIIFASGFRIIMQNLFGIENEYLHLFLGTLVGIFVSIAFVSLVRKVGWYFLFSSPKK